MINKQKEKGNKELKGEIKNIREVHPEIEEEDDKYYQIWYLNIGNDLLISSFLRVGLIYHI